MIASNRFLSASALSPQHNIIQTHSRPPRAHSLSFADDKNYYATCAKLHVLFFPSALPSIHIPLSELYWHSMFDRARLCLRVYACPRSPEQNLLFTVFRTNFLMLVASNAHKFALVQQIFEQDAREVLSVLRFSKQSSTRHECQCESELPVSVKTKRIDGNGLIFNLASYRTR